VEGYLLQHGGKVGAGEFPLERFGDLLVMALEAEDALLQVLKRGEVVRKEKQGQRPFLGQAI